ncbi:MAG: nucleotide exchange factor GrpE, partial [Planctomycetota bacterium]
MTQKRRRKTVRDGARERPPIEKAPAEKPPVVTATPEDVAREVGAAPERPSSDGVCELEDRLRRVQADFVNDLKRIERQADDRARYAVEGLLTDLLPVFDALHSAREGFASRVEADGEADDTARAAVEGFDLVGRELLG